MLDILPARCCTRGVAGFEADAGAGTAFQPQILSISQSVMRGDPNSALNAGSIDFIDSHTNNTFQPKGAKVVDVQRRRKERR